jgi:hypothetical protein
MPGQPVIKDTVKSLDVFLDEAVKVIQHNLQKCAPYLYLQTHTMLLQWCVPTQIVFLIILLDS